MNTIEDIFEALHDHHREQGGYEYDDVNEWDQTGAPFTITREDGVVGFGIELNSNGTDCIEVWPPYNADARGMYRGMDNYTAEWAYMILRNCGEPETEGVLPFTWKDWNELRIDKATASLMKLLREHGGIA